MASRRNKKNKKKKSKNKMNVITFDIEEWYIEKKFYGGRSEKYQQFETYLKRILDILDEQNIKATFFCLGKIATEFPSVIKAIVERHHEIGCHSNEHLWLTKMTPDILRQDTRDAISALQDVSGQKVISYRAPAFSIGESNKWAIEILAESGIECDASIFPAKRDFGGFEGFPTTSPVIISYNGTEIKEFPIPLVKIFNYDVAYSGGGYFRFFPYSYIKRNIIATDYAMTYFHIGDLLYNKGGIMTKEEYEKYFKEPGTLKNRVLRYIKSNLGTKTAFDKMERLIKDFDFISISQAKDEIDWSALKIIEL